MSKSYKWLLIALLSCAFFFHQADRALFGLLTICMGFIGGFAGALFFRSIATGVGESFYAPSAYALIACHHKETRSVALERSGEVHALRYDAETGAFTPLATLGGLYRPVALTPALRKEARK